MPHITPPRPPAAPRPPRSPIAASTASVALVAGLALATAVAMPGAALAAQDLASRESTATRHAPRSVDHAAPAVSAGATATVAVRAVRPPVLDGRDDDPVWRGAPLIDGFRVFDPVEDGDPHFRTEARVAYDEHNLYVFVRAFDPHPDSIVALLSRRDVRTASDQIKVLIDAYHDRRSGFEFAVNPAGVKRDYAIINDGDEDAAWDAVWDVATRIDSLGWTAEFRIPLSQLRYPAAETHTFGIMLNRDVARTNERVAWPVFRRSKGGISSQFGEVRGIDGIASPRRLEVVPYTVARTSNVPLGARWGMRSQGTSGADVKYGITSSLTLDATVNPDFGQVEADPSVLNLSAFETFFPEKRPFFLEGQGLFRFDLNCNDGQCSGLFYSRRIGRQPQLADWYGGDAPFTQIAGAAKLTGRLSHGTAVGILDATTRREVGPGRSTVEPQTNYFVGRVQQDFRGGASSVGVMLTNVRRSLDQWSDSLLRREAFAVGVDGRHQFLDKNFEISGYLARSVVSGSASAIARTQRSAVHFFQRPDGDVAFDSTRTSLGGATGQVLLQKRGGDITRFATGYQILTPGFEINDLGYLQRASAQNQFLWFALVFQEPRAFYRNAQINLNQWTNFTYGGLRTELGGNVNAHAQLDNGVRLHVGQGGNALAPSLCDNCARGGPAVRQDRSLWGWEGISGDERRSVVPNFFVQWGRGDGGRSYNWSMSPAVDLRVASRFSASLGVSYGHYVNGAQYDGTYGDVGSDTTHYTFARLDQRILATTARLNLTATPTLSLEIYAQPFVSKGDFSNWVQLHDPRAERWSDRYTPYAGGDPGAFNFQQYRSNTVVRWEYRPGSVLYLVWSQDRTGSAPDVDTARRLNAQGRYQDVFSIHPGNVFLVKGSYWLSL